MNNIEVNVMLEREIFKSEDGYQIIKCLDVDSDDNHILVGHFMPLQKSITYKIIGKMKEHTKYGDQIEVISVEQYVISDKDKLVDYFAGGLFFGIGRVTATNIVEALGDDAISKILDDDTILLGVKNLSERKAKKLSAKLKELNDSSNPFNMLLNAGFSQKVASKIYGDYKESIKAIIESDPFIVYYENPYKYQIQTFFDVCSKLEIEKSDIRYIGACIYEYINQTTFNSGDTYITIEELSGFENIDETLDYMQSINVLHIDENNVMIKRMYDAEQTIANFILNNRSGSETDFVFDFDDELELFCKSKNITFAPEQVDAIKQTFLNKVSVITGGPGTGKTTIVSAICKIFINAYNIDLGDDIFSSELVLLAPTGRAAKRMNEQTMISAATIHRYLKWDIGSNNFEYNKMNKCNAKVVIIDEVSMIDTYLFANLIDALNDDVVVVLIGDDMQLSSVGCGDILRDIIDVDKVCISKLTKVYRQDDDTLINFMHDIRNYKVPSDLTSKYTNRNFIVANTDNIFDVIKDVISRIKVKNLDIFDFQFLIPIYKGSVGIDNINKLCQTVFNEASEGKKEYELNKTTFRVGDKVIITKNYPNENVYNGDLGIIKNIFYREKRLICEILFDSKVVEFSGEDLYSISHGYAISIHKSQGSEFKHVIIPVTIAYRNMLKHDLIYTAITRASESLLIVGQESAFVNSVCSSNTKRRQTNLSTMLGNSVVSPFDFM